MPKRIATPDGAVYVGRPSKWGNPFTVGSYLYPSRWAAVNAYRKWIAGQVAEGRLDLAELAGKDLYCPGCRDTPGSCHADVLLELANGTS